MTTSWEFTATQLLRFDDRTARRSRPWLAGSMSRGASEGASVRIFLLHGRSGLTSPIILLFSRLRELEAHAAWRPSPRRWGIELRAGGAGGPAPFERGWAHDSERGSPHHFPMLSSNAARWHDVRWSPCLVRRSSTSAACVAHSVSR